MFTLRATFRGTLRRTGFWLAAALAGLTRIDTFQENIDIIIKHLLRIFPNCIKILWGKIYRKCQPGLLLVVENVGDAALVATSAGYSGKMMLETCEFIRVK